MFGAFHNVHPSSITHLKWTCPIPEQTSMIVRKQCDLRDFSVKESAPWSSESRVDTGIGWTGGLINEIRKGSHLMAVIQWGRTSADQCKRGTVLYDFQRKRA